MAVIVTGTGMSVPKKKVKNEDLPAALQTSDEWVRSHTGIGSRYIAGEGETTTLLGAESAKKALAAAGIDAAELDLIVFTSNTMTYVAFPTESCLLQAELGADYAACFDLLAACTGFVYALDVAAGIMERRGYKYALICSTEILSKLLDWTDRKTCILFGDGSGSVVLENTAVTGFDAGERGLKDMCLRSNGNGAMALYCEHGGFVKMNGKAIYDFAVAEIASIIKHLMIKNELSVDDIDMFVCHQANARIITAAAKRLSLPLSKFVISIEEYGNTSSASIPITLANLEEQGKLKKGMRLVLAGFGAGLTSAGGIVVW